jgi:thiamine kinase-like enzyme
MLIFPNRIFVPQAESAGCSLICVTGDAENSTSDTRFSVQSTRRTLETACRAAKFDPVGATLIRLGENALYRLSDNATVVRIARTMAYWSQVENEVSVAEWLTEMGYPAARVVHSQPSEIDGHPVTFWHFIPGRTATPEELTELALLLRRFHALPKPIRFDLPRVNFDDRVERRLNTASVRSSDRSYLQGKFRELRSDLHRLHYPLAESPLHGDAHIQNVMVSNSTSVLIDFEATGWGQPEWDLAVTATEYVTAKWWTGAQYAAFSESYGYDVTSWAGFDVLRQIQEIKMTTWLMQNINQSSEIADEFAVRMRTIRTGRSDQPWRPY